MIDTTIDNSMPDGREPDAQDLELMRALTLELGAALEPFEIPAAQDTALREAARTRGRAIRRAKELRDRRRWIAVTGALACAAAVVLFVAFGGLWGGASDPQLRGAVVVPGDINADGAVDVIDAMVLAKALEAGPNSTARFDVTGDGEVDQSDVDWIAAKAVRIDGSAL